MLVLESSTASERIAISPNQLLAAQATTRAQHLLAYLPLRRLQTSRSRPSAGSSESSSCCVHDRAFSLTHTGDCLIPLKGTDNTILDNNGTCLVSVTTIMSNGTPSLNAIVWATFVIRPCGEDAMPKNEVIGSPGHERQSGHGIVLVPQGLLHTWPTSMPEVVAWIVPSSLRMSIAAAA
jgi:hypothetical protein